MDPSTPPRTSSPLNPASRDYPSTPPRRSGALAGAGATVTGVAGPGDGRTAPSPLLSRPPSTLTVPVTPEGRYPPYQNLTTPTPRHAHSLLPNTPSTVQKAINTALPSTPPQPCRAQPRRLFGSPSQPTTTSQDVEVELSPLSRRDYQPPNHHHHPHQHSESPFHDRHSIIVDTDSIEDLNESPSLGRQRTVPGYRFAGAKLDTDPDTNMDTDAKEELAFGGELDVYISEKRRSLYPSIPPTPLIPASTLRDHPDLLPDDTPRLPLPPSAIVPRFRRLLSLSTKRDIFLLLIPGILLAGATALVPPFMSIVIGDTFQIFAAYPLLTRTATAERRTELLEGVRYQTILLASAGLFAVVTNYVKAVIWAWHGEVIAARLRQKVFSGVLSKRMEWYDMGMGMRDEDEEAIGAGGLMAKFSKETDDVRIGTAQAMGNFVQYFGSFLLCFILAMVKAPVLSLVTLSTIPLVVIVQIVTQVFAAPLYAAERQGFAQASTDVERCTNAISTVKAHNAQQAEKTRFDNIILKVKASLVKQAVLWGLSISVTDFLLLATFVSGFWYGADQVRKGNVESGDVMTVFWACLLASSYLQQAVPTLTFITKGKMSMASMLTVIQDAEGTAAERGSGSGGVGVGSNGSKGQSGKEVIRPGKCIGEFNFHSVSFAYPTRPDNKVLRDITLFLPPSETTFVVGGSGSGKSTIAQLLLRLYSSTGGDITLDDNPLEEIDEEFTKEHIAAVQQGCILFDMSIHDNVALGAPGRVVSRDKVMRACKVAMIHEFVVSLPEGYETRLGTGGSSLSGGQRQRLAIARARIRDPSVLILDEATSALDATSRVQVFENIKSWRRNRTTIVITHDLSQIVGDDFVYVMKDGKVAEQGFRSDLMKKPQGSGMDDGVFATMAAEQAVEPVPMKWEPQASVEDLQEALLLYNNQHQQQQQLQRPLSRPPSITVRPATPSFSMRPQSLAYFDLLDDYVRSDRNSGVPGGNTNTIGISAGAGAGAGLVVSGAGARAGAGMGAGTTKAEKRMSMAQRRLSWGPNDLNPRLAPPSAYHTLSGGSRTSLVYAQQPQLFHSLPPSRTSSAMSVQRPTSRMSRQMSSGMEATRSMTRGDSRQRTLSQNLDDDLKVYDSGNGKDDPTLPHVHSLSIAITDEEKGPLPGIFHIIRTNVPLMPHKWLFILGLFGALAHGLATPIWANFLSRLMSILAEGGTDPMLTTYALIVLAICFAQAFAGYIQEYALYAVAAHWTSAIRSTAYEKVLSQEKGWFDRPGNAPSVLVQNLIKDADDMRNAVSQIVGKMVVFASMVTMGIIWAMVIQWRLTLVGLAIAPVFAIVVVVNEVLVGRAEMKNKDMRDRVGKLFYESVSNVRGIRAMALEGTFKGKFNEDAALAVRTGKRAGFFVGVGIAASSCMPLVAMALLNWVGCIFMLQDHMNYAQLLMVYNLILFSLTFGSQALDFIPMMAKVKVAARDFNRLYYLPSSSYETGDLRFPINGNISFDNVHFSYPTRPDVPVLNGVTFRLTPGECIAIVGPSGSGKSTIASLLQRLYDSSGITINRHDLSKSDVRWLRDHIAIVSQTANLFDASVTENISYGSDVPIGEIHRAAKAANIHEFILSLPAGYDTNLGENASLISGGQAQRLQIARALVRRSTILILDEATSALDVDNQRAILDTIVRIKETRTTIFITHSVEAMKRCDRIICLDQGKVAEDGSYDELVRRNGVFAQLMKTGEWE